MGKMRRAQLYRPVFHRGGDNVRHTDIKASAVLDGAHHRLIGLLWQARSHRRIVENIRAEHLRNCLHRNLPSAGTGGLI